MIGYRLCGWLTRGHHFWGPVHFDRLFKTRARVCRICRVTELLSETKEGRLQDADQPADQSSEAGR